MTERRKCKRFPVAYPMEFSHKGGKKALSLVDVSEKGLAFTSSDDLRENEEVDLHIFLKKRMFALKGIVVYTIPQRTNGHYSVGVKLLSVPEDFRKVLSREVEDIMQFCREANLYHNKSLSIEQASMKYLENFPLP